MKWTPVYEQNKAARKLCLRLAAKHGTCGFVNGCPVNNNFFIRKSPVLQGIFLLFKNKSVMIFLIIIIIAVTHAAFAAE